MRGSAVLARRGVAVVFAAALLLPAALAGQHALSISGTRFLLNGEPFPFTAVSFFNAIYNPEFNRSSGARKAWLAKFQKYGINVLRVWCQWNNKRGFVDSGPGKSLYHPDGHLREEHLATLEAIVADADERGMIIQVVLFSQESWHDGIKLAPEAEDRAVAAVARGLQPHVGPPELRRAIARRLVVDHGLPVTRQQILDLLRRDLPGAAGGLAAGVRREVIEGAHGVPDPEFSPYHRQVFEFLALRDRYLQPGMTKP